MKTIICGFCAMALLWSSCSALAQEQPSMSLDKYTCGQFLADVAKPNDGSKLLKPMMLIAWSTGYAAAHQKGTPRSDNRAFELISITLGDTCRKAPDKIAVNAFVKVITRVAR